MIAEVGAGIGADVVFIALLAGGYLAVGVLGLRAVLRRGRPAQRDHPDEAGPGETRHRKDPAWPT
ncbi:hypothetical protein BJF78_09395 [Pseudonocardia sp. CNS-139]|nr:hypothetical protein BJF78_09395 [Pseudonocardia sp. CNS-139]